MTTDRLLPDGAKGDAAPAVALQDLRFLTETGDPAAVRAATEAKALVQAKFIMALQRPRVFPDFRDSLMRCCKRPAFAAVARYRNPWGGGRDGSQNYVEGPSIRFADEATKLMHNVDVTKSVVFEDEEERKVRVTVLELETNVSKSEEITIKKTVERRKPRDGEDVLRWRQNSRGVDVAIVAANEDQLFVKESAMCAKVRRNLELQIIPQDLTDEAMESVQATVLNEGARDPDKARKDMLDAFSGIGIKPSELKEYLGHDLERLQPKELADLRLIWQAIHEGEANWSDYYSGSPKTSPLEQEANGKPDAPHAEQPKGKNRKSGRVPEKKQPEPEPEAPADETENETFAPPAADAPDTPGDLHAVEDPGTAEVVAALNERGIPTDDAVSYLRLLTWLKQDEVLVDLSDKNRGMLLRGMDMFARKVTAWKEANQS